MTVQGETRCTMPKGWGKEVTGNMTRGRGAKRVGESSRGNAGKFGEEVTRK